MPQVRSCSGSAPAGPRGGVAADRRYPEAVDQVLEAGAAERPKGRWDRRPVGAGEVNRRHWEPAEEPAQAEAEAGRRRGAQRRRRVLDVEGRVGSTGCCWSMERSSSVVGNGGVGGGQWRRAGACAQSGAVTKSMSSLDPGEKCRLEISIGADAAQDAPPGGGEVGLRLVRPARRLADPDLPRGASGICGQVCQPSRCGRTDCQMSTYGCPTTSTCGRHARRDRTASTIAVSLLPGTRWSTRTRAAGRGRARRPRWRRRGRRPVEHLDDDALDAQVGAPHLSTSSASWRPRHTAGRLERRWRGGR